MALIFSVFISACGNNSASITTQTSSSGGIQIPQAIATQLPGTGDLYAYISIDDGNRTAMKINGDTASITLTNVPTGAHSITIEFDFVFKNDPNKPTTPLILATASKSINIVGGDNALNFAGADYQTSKYDEDFDGVSNLDELANNTDPFTNNNTPGLNIGALSGNGHTSENGDTATFRLSLTTKPSDSVTIDINSSNTSEGTVSPSSIVFTPADWNQAQTVTITGVDDPVPVADGPQTYMVTLSVPVTSDANYNQLSSNDITVINDDNEPVPVISLSLNKAAIAEASGTAELTATSSVASNKDIVTTLDFSNSTASVSNDYTVAAGSITIPAGKTTGKTVITALQDVIPEGNETVVADIKSVTNGNPDATPATLTIIDDDFSVGGSVTGYAGTGLVLQNNTSDNLSISGTSFTFPVGLTTGSGYNVTVFAQPTAQYCTVANATGSIAGKNVSNVSVNCQDTTLQVSSSEPNILTFSWSALTGATSYKLLVNPDGKSGYTQVGTDTTSSSMDVAPSVLQTDWFNASYILEAYNGTTLISTSPVFQAINAMIDAIGYFKASNTGPGDGFGGTGNDYGYAIALSSDGKTLAVGARSENSAAIGINGKQFDGCSDPTPTNCSTYSGAVFVFSNNSGKWTQEAYIKASNTGASNAFGGAVAISADGNTLAVGSSGESSPSIGIGGDQTNDCDAPSPVKCASSSGAVYIFSRSNGQWSQQAYIKASNTQAKDIFGVKVALSADGNTVAATAFYESSSAKGVDCNGVNFGDLNLNNIPDCEEDNSVVSSGAAYVFVRSGTVWSQDAYVKASNGEYSDLFGWSVSLSGDGNTLAVGSWVEDSSFIGISTDGTGESDNAAPGAGAVYVFSHGASGWAQQAYVKASNTESLDHFGDQVALSYTGDALVVSADQESSNALGVDCNGINFSDTSPQNGIPDCEEDNTLGSSGAVYVYQRSSTSVWSQQSYIKASNTGASDQFGSSIAISPDGNTLAIGASAETSHSYGITLGAPNVADNGGTYRGAIYLFKQSGGVWSQQGYIKDNHANESYGMTISLSSDGSKMATSMTDSSATTGINGDRNYNCSITPPLNCAIGSGGVLLY